MDRISDVVSVSRTPQGGHPATRPEPMGPRVGAQGETAAPTDGIEGHLRGYLDTASASDGIYNALGAVQNADSTPAPQPASARPHPREETQTRQALGDRPPRDDTSLRAWRQGRRNELSSIASDKLTHTHDLRRLNANLNSRFKSTNRGLTEFDKASQTAIRQPGRFLSSLHNLVSQCEAYGDLVGQQIQNVRAMRARNAAIDKAGGARPTASPATRATAANASSRDGEMVSGPLSANVDQPDAERLVGTAELHSTREQLSAAISTLRQSIVSMRRGLGIVRDVNEGEYREHPGSPRGVRQRDVVAERDAGAKGVVDRDFRTEQEHRAVSRLEVQLQTLQQGYDELGFL